MPHFLKRKERLILTAIEIIHDLGFQGLSIKELAMRQKITEGAIYRHFKSKNEVVLEVLDYFAQFDTDILQSIHMKHGSPKDSILYVMNRYGEYYQSYPAMTAILHSYEMLRHEEAIAYRVAEIYHHRVNTMRDIIQNGIDMNTFSSNTNVVHLADVIMGTLYATTLRWRMNNFAFSLKDELQGAVLLVMNALNVSSPENL